MEYHPRPGDHHTQTHRLTRHRTRSTVVSAANADLYHLQNHSIARGRYFDPVDEREGHRVAVLGGLFESSRDRDGRGFRLLWLPW